MKMESCAYHKYAIEKLKARCDMNIGDRCISNEEARRVLANVHIPYGLQATTLNEMVSMGLIKRKNQRTIIIVKRCPICNGNNLTKRKTGKKEYEYCFFCRDCKDQIAKEAVL